MDLSTTYLGFDLPHPIVPSSSPLTGDLDRIHSLIEAGAPAIVLPSLFEEQIEHDSMAIHESMELGASFSGELADGFFPELDDYRSGTTEHVELVRRIKDETSVPVIASLNGASLGGWIRYAETLVDAGADAIEINTYRIASDLDLTAQDVEREYLELVAAIRECVEVPLAVKVGPYFSSFGHVARHLADAGADAIVLFNRFYQPDISLTNLEVEPDLVLSDPSELRLVVRWLAILHGNLSCDLAATSGVHGPDDALKAVLAGATVAMMASALLRYGPARLTEVRDGMSTWLADHGYSSLAQARGSLSRNSVPDPEVYDRWGYMRTLHSYAPTW